MLAFFFKFSNFSNIFCILDYVLLNSKYLNLTGLSFANVSAGTVSIKSGMINGLNMSDFILTSKTQDIYGIKKFKNLSAKSILSNKRINEVSCIILEFKKIL